MRPQTSVAALVPLRLFVGWIFLIAGIGKITGGWMTSNSHLLDILSGWLHDGRPYRFYAPFLRDVVIPKIHTFSILIPIGELCVGATLLLGLLTRVSALAGMTMAMAYLLGRGDGLGNNNTAPIIIMCLTLMLTQPGRVLGIDAALRGKVPSWIS